jgi:hypothetical protein
VDGRVDVITLYLAKYSEDLFQYNFSKHLIKKLKFPNRANVIRGSNNKNR